MRREVLGGSAAAAVDPLPVRVLVCDDEDAIRRLYHRALPGDRFEVFDAVDADDCVAQASARQPDLVILDVTLPGRSGLDVLPEVRRACPAARIVVISGLLTSATVATATERGADGCVGKLDLLSSVRDLVGELAR